MPALEDDNLPEIRQSSYSGQVPETNYNSYNGSSTTIRPNKTIGPSTNSMSNTSPVLTNSSPTNSASDADVLVKNTNSDWINKKWRPMMGWTYMATCTFDFIIAPILWSIVQALTHGGQVASQWQPLTLQGAGLYHVAMGAVLGVAAFGRTKEKIEQRA